jgi:hypothetical protein
MNFSPNELVDTVDTMLRETLRFPSWKKMTQWEIEARRHTLGMDRASQYNVLRLLNSVKRTVRHVNGITPAILRSAHVTAELDKVDTAERRKAKAFISELNARLRELNAAYTVVTSSCLLARDIMHYSSGKQPVMLKNEHGRWHTTAGMYRAYLEMLDEMKKKNPPQGMLPEKMEENAKLSAKEFRRNITHFNPEEEYESYKVTGKAIIYAGVAAGGWPVLVSLYCTFDLDGQVVDLPENFKVLAFKPKTATITKAFMPPKKTEEKSEEGPSKEV